MTRADLGQGVPFALGPDGRVVNPVAAQHRERFYRCLVCDEYIFLKAGDVRVSHFSHYAKRETPCSAETALHEAAKRRLAERLRDGLSTVLVRIPCKGFANEFGHEYACSEAIEAEHRLEVPSFDTASVEVPFGSFRLDAAAIRGGRVVFGLEVYQSNAVDPVKQAFLNRSNLPWLELRAHDVMHEEMPWALLAGSPKPFQCSSCAAEAAAAARLRAQYEEEDRQREAEERKREERERFGRRNVLIAHRGRTLVRPEVVQAGAKAKCFGCDQELVATRIGGKNYWSHAGGFECDTRRGWIRAGMLALYNQLHHQPGAIKVIRRCEGSRYGQCKKWLTDRLPAYDRVDGAGLSLVLRREGTPVAQITFSREYVRSGAPLVLAVRTPSRLLKDPATLIQERDGTYCAACEGQVRQRSEERAAAMEQNLHPLSQPVVETQRPKTDERRLALLTHAVTRGFSREERERALEIARAQLSALSIDVGHAAGYSVTVRTCGSCEQETVTIEPHGMKKYVPIGLDALLDDSSGPLRCKCAVCGAVADAEAADGGIPVSSAFLAARPRKPS